MSCFVCMPLAFLYTFFFVIRLVSRVVCLHFIHSEKFGFGCVRWRQFEHMRVPVIQENKFKREKSTWKISDFCVFHWIAPSTHIFNVQQLYSQMCPRRLFVSVLFWFQFQMHGIKWHQHWRTTTIWLMFSHR